MITDFHFYYNNKYKHLATKMTPREILFNYKNKEMILKVIINTDKSRKYFYQEIDYDEGYYILITPWHLELSNKRIRTFNRKAIKRNESSKKRDSQYQLNNNRNFIIEL